VCFMCAVFIVCVACVCFMCAVFIVCVAGWYVVLSVIGVDSAH
jgi:hypothetical protein